VERRLQRLENLFAQRLPDVNLEEALASSQLNGPASPSARTQSPTTPDFNDLEAALTPRSENASKISEAVPQEADGFDWQEDFSELADGMAALSVEPRGTGYLGERYPLVVETTSNHLKDLLPAFSSYAPSFCGWVARHPCPALTVHPSMPIDLVDRLYRRTRRFIHWSLGKSWLNSLISTLAPTISHIHSYTRRHLELSFMS
jgi:hypothetical protein